MSGAPAMSGVTEDIRSFSCRFFFLGVLLSGGMLGPMGAAGSNCPRFFSPFSPFFSTSGGVGSDAPGPTRPRFFLVFFSTAGVASAAWSAPGPTHPRFFSLLFPRQEGWHPHGAHQARLALVFSLFFFPRQEEWRQPQGWPPHGPHQARLALVFSLFFSTPGGVASATGVASAWAAPGPTRLRVFYPLFSTSGGVGWSRQLRVEGASQACFFFHAFASSRHLKAAVEGEEGEGLQHLEGETRCCR